MLYAKFFALCLLLSPSFLFAAQNKSENQVVSEASELRLTVSKVKLAQALNEIAKKAGTPVHYSTLPEQLVTADCIGNIKTVLACLLGKNADIVYRYSRYSLSNERQAQPLEVWILEIPTLVNEFKAERAIPGNTGKRQGQEETAEHNKLGSTELFIEQVKDPQLRMDAIANLAMVGRKDDLRVRSVLKEALSDSNSGVRLQAVLAIAQRDGDDSLADIERAMSDENADVRRMAVEGVGNNNFLLELALKDADANIRQYAATKLGLLNKANNEN